MILSASVSGPQLQRHGRVFVFDVRDMPPMDGKPTLAPAPGAAAVTTASTGGRATPPVAPVPRPRNHGGRKKALAIEPDSLYRGTAARAPTPSVVTGQTQAQAMGSTVVGAKRGAEGAHEPRKRKRVDAVRATHAGGSGSGRMAGGGSAIAGGGVANNSQNSQYGTNSGVPEADGPSSLIEFSTLPTSALYEYIIQFDLVPFIYPTPLTAEDPPPPIALLDPGRMASRAPTPTRVATPTLANRPRRTREAKDGSRRRSTRLEAPPQVPVLADVAAVHGVLAAIAGRHLRGCSVREVDTLASFMGAVKARR